MLWDVRNLENNAAHLEWAYLFVLKDDNVVILGEIMDKVIVGILALLVAGMYVIGKFLVFALLAWVLCLALSTPFSWSYPVVLYIAQIIVRLIIK